MSSGRGGHRLNFVSPRLRHVMSVRMRCCNVDMFNVASRIVSWRTKAPNSRNARAMRGREFHHLRGEKAKEVAGYPSCIEVEHGHCVLGDTRKEI
jgi:hypothetical protein